MDKPDMQETEFFGQIVERQCGNPKCGAKLMFVVGVKIPTGVREIGGRCIDDEEEGIKEGEKIITKIATLFLQLNGREVEEIKELAWGEEAAKMLDDHLAASDTDSTVH